MVDIASQFETIGQAFTSHYYTLFDNPQTRTDGLINLYLAQQCFQTFEGHKSSGIEQIKQKLASLTFQRIRRSYTSIDCQPLPDGILIVVLGRLQTDEDPPQSFQETFILKQANGGFFITNDVFRLVLHHA